MRTRRAWAVAVAVLLLVHAVPAVGAPAPSLDRIVKLARRAAEPLARNAVRSRNIAPEAVKMGHLAPAAVRTRHLGDGSVVRAKIADDAVGPLQIAPDSIGASQILADGIGTAELASAAVGASDLAPAAVDSRHLATGAVGSVALADDAVTSAKVAAAAIGPSELADGAVDAAAIAESAVEAGDIAPDAVGGSEIAAGAVTTSELADGTVTPADLAPSAGTRSVAVPLGFILAGANIERPVFVAPTNGTIVGVSFTTKTAIVNSDTNYVSLSVLRKTGPAATVKATTTQATGGSTFAAFSPVRFTDGLEATSFTAADLFALKAVHTGAGAHLDELLVTIEYVSRE